MLLIQALMSRRAPAVARTMAFQKDLLRWQAAMESGVVSEGRETEEAQAELPRSMSQEEPAAPEMPIATAAQKSAVGTQLIPSTDVAPENLFEKPVAAEPIAAKGSKTRDTTAHSEALPSYQAAIRDQSVDSAEPSQPPGIDDQPPALRQHDAGESTAGRSEAQPKQVSGPATTLETEYGGVFFLLSLALYLYIYGDFTSPAEPGLELNIWDFLALMAFELTDGEIANDPLWDELASLAGRPRSVRPGLGFDPPDDGVSPANGSPHFPKVTCRSRNS